MATEVYSTLFTEVTGEQYGELRQKDGIVDKVSYPASFVKDDWTKR